MSTNSKAEEARSRKMEAQTQKKVEEERQRQETFWKDAEGPLSKAEKKKSEDAMRRTEAAAKRAEAKKLAEQEENELAQYGKRVDKKATRVAMPVPKVCKQHAFHSLPLVQYLCCFSGLGLGFGTVCPCSFNCSFGSKILNEFWHARYFLIECHFQSLECLAAAPSALIFMKHAVAVRVHHFRVLSSCAT